MPPANSSPSYTLVFLAALAGGLVAGGLLMVVFLSGPAWRHPADGAAPPYPANQTPPAAVTAPVYLTSHSSAPAAAPSDLRNAAQRATPTVVRINALASQGKRERVKALFGDGKQKTPRNDGEGSGVIYRADGYIVTNYHVVRGAEEITVTTADRRRFAASLVGQDEKSDLAVLRINASGLPTLKFADSDAAQPGEWVLAVGSPLGLASTVTAGIISAKGRSIRLFKELDAIESFLQTDAAVNPGNSGGPLVSAEGKLLGINTAIATHTGRFQGYSFAIPVNLVRRITDDIIEFGTYQRAYLGVEISSLTSYDVRRLGLRNRTEGVVVDEVFADGSAAAAGLLANDVIVSVGGRPVRDLPDLTEIVGRARIGETLKIGVVRNEKPRELLVKMKAYPE